MSLANLLRSAGLGRLAYQLWFRQAGKLREVIAAGGPMEVRRTELGRREMEAAACSLPILAEHYATSPLELHLLTGKRFWYQTAFCLWTFARHSKCALRPVLYDDGTLKAEQHDFLKRLFPRAQFHSPDETVARLDAHLPERKFPALRERWRNYPNIRKLTDVHIGQTGWKLAMDSDLLFFRRPDFLLDWLEHPCKPLHALDCETSYGYSRSLMTELAGAPVADLVNVGLTGLDGGELDWEKLEFWTHALIQRERTSYYLEQAVIAMLVAERDCAIAPAGDYVTMPVEPEARDCNAAMHHYVAHAKKWYFRHCWREALRKSPGPSQT